LLAARPRPEDIEEMSKLFERRSTGVFHRGHGMVRAIFIEVQDRSSGAGLDGHEAHAMCHHVVKFASDVSAFVFEDLP
jgi:hypothetical protein